MIFKFHYNGSAKRPAATPLLKLDDSVTPFDCLFPKAAVDPIDLLSSAGTALTTNQLKLLGQFQADLPVELAVNSTMLPIYTYLGQLIDHDLAANTRRNREVTNIHKEVICPLDPDIIKTNLGNLRKPKVDRDSQYRDWFTLESGPSIKAIDFYGGIRFKMGADHIIALSVRGFAVGELSRDHSLRDGKLPIIADSTNEEYLIVDQFHLMLRRFHILVVDRISENAPLDSNAKTFAKVLDFVRWHYERFCVHDYLMAAMVQGNVDKKLFDGTTFYEKIWNEVLTPLEFYGVPFCIKCAMEVCECDFNRNFGMAIPPNNHLVSTVSSSFIFQFVGKRKLDCRSTLPFNRAIEWRRFVNEGTGNSMRFVRKIDTHLTLLSANLKNKINEYVMRLSTPLLHSVFHLATLNLHRNDLLPFSKKQNNAPTIANNPLSVKELDHNNTSEIVELMDIAGFIERTPTWYYILKEFEICENGNSLGETECHFFAEIFVNIMFENNISFLNRDFDPSIGVKFEDGSSLVNTSDMIRFTGLESVDCLTRNMRGFQLCL